jgi:aspartate/methionine/tyrosine aminotransferase
VHIEPFATEQFFDAYEFSCPHALSASDCESMSIAELVAMAGLSMDAFGRVPLQYTEARGVPELRERVAAQYSTVTPDEVVVLGAPEEGIYTAMRALLDPDDAVVVLTPCYDSLANVARHIGCRVEPHPLQPVDGGWSLDLERFEAQLRAVEPRLVVVNFPHNPTGFLPDARQYAALVDMTEKVGAWLLSDEMYRGLELDPASRLPSAADVSDRAVVLGGLSKTHGLPGLRAGWLVIREPTLREAVVNWKHYTTICASAPSQWLASAALRVSDELAARSVATIRHNLGVAEAFFSRWGSRFVWRPPVAGSVALVQTRHADAAEYCGALARRAGIVLLPGSCVGAPPQFVRFGLGRRAFPESLAAYDADLAAGS